MQYEIGYTFCDFWILPASIRMSAESAKRFLPKEKITGFYTPPRCTEIYDSLKDVLTIKKVPNITKAFATLDEWHSHYGEKIHVSALNSPNVLYLDCDVLIVHDIDSVWEDDFDVAVSAQSPCQEGLMKDFEYKKNWDKMFKRFDKKPGPYLTTNCIFAKDNIFKEIKDEWIYMLEQDIPRITKRATTLTKEEYVLSMLMSDKKVKFLDDTLIRDFPLRIERGEPFYPTIQEWETEPHPLLWHIGKYGLKIKF